MSDCGISPENSGLTILRFNVHKSVLSLDPCPCSKAWFLQVVQAQAQDISLHVYSVFTRSNLFPGKIWMEFGTVTFIGRAQVLALCLSSVPFPQNASLHQGRFNGDKQCKSSFARVYA